MRNCYSQRHSMAVHAACHYLWCKVDSWKGCAITRGGERDGSLKMTNTAGFHNLNFFQPYLLIYRNMNCKQSKRKMALLKAFVWKPWNNFISIFYNFIGCVLSLRDKVLPLQQLTFFQLWELPFDQYLLLFVRCSTKIFQMKCLPKECTKRYEWKFEKYQTGKDLFILL